MDNASPGLFCPHCGYDLRTLTINQCPECGGAVDEKSLREISIPWQGRADIGRWRALWRTAWRVTFKTKAFCQSVALPVSYADARRFQYTVVGAFFISFVITVIILAANAWGLDLLADQAQWLGFSGLGASLLAVLYFACLGLCLLLGTGIHTYWFHPSKLTIEQQNRAIALSYYACAPLLALIPVQLGLIAFAVAMRFVPEGGIPESPEILLGIAPRLMIAIDGLAIAGQRGQELWDPRRAVGWRCLRSLQCSLPCSFWLFSVCPWCCFTSA